MRDSACESIVWALFGVSRAPGFRECGGGMQFLMYGLVAYTTEGLKMVTDLPLGSLPDDVVRTTVGRTSRETARL